MKERKIKLVKQILGKKSNWNGTKFYKNFLELILVKLKWDIFWGKEVWWLEVKKVFIKSWFKKKLYDPGISKNSLEFHKVLKNQESLSRNKIHKSYYSRQTWKSF